MYNKHVLTHLSLASFFGTLANSDSTAESCLLSGAPLFAYKMLYQNLNRNKQYYLTILKTEMD